MVSQPHWTTCSHIWSSLLTYFSPPYYLLKIPSWHKTVSRFLNENLKQRNKDTWGGEEETWEKDRYKGKSCLSRGGEEMQGEGMTLRGLRPVEVPRLEQWVKYWAAAKEQEPPHHDHSVWQGDWRPWTGEEKCLIGCWRVIVEVFICSLSFLNTRINI